MKKNEVDDTISNEMLIRMRPFAEVFPVQAESFIKRGRGQRGPGKVPPKELISLRVDHDVVESYRKTGPGWQRRMNDALRAALPKE